MIRRSTKSRKQLIRHLAALFVGGAVLSIPAATAHAANYWWDIDGNIAGAGGASPAGTWSSGGTTWSTDSTGATATSAYTTTTSDDLFFAAGTNATGAYTVTLTTTQAAQSLNFEEGAVTFSGAGGIINLGGTGTISVNSASRRHDWK